ncbi:MAG: choice-of-anchor D domain-containing protein [Chloroflexi bacterium]|nr:choice-of-anchor D domain-containing protein [Chloroflexota bacterium]
MKDLYKRFGTLALLVLLFTVAVPLDSTQAGHRRAPEINVRTGFTDISDNTGSVTFNEIHAGQSTLKDFVIENSGRGTLTIGNVTVPDGFRVAYISRTSIGPNGIGRITVSCGQGTAGTFSGEMSIENNDADENPYNFTITCIVHAQTPPDMAVFNEADLSLIPDDTGSITVTGTQGQFVEIEISIHNSGTSNLFVSEPTVPAGFRFDDLTGCDSVTPGNSEICFITCIGDTVGTFSGEVSFENNDPDENPYNFTLTCIIN